MRGVLANAQRTRRRRLGVLQQVMQPIERRNLERRETQSDTDVLGQSACQEAWDQTQFQMRPQRRVLRQGLVRPEQRVRLTAFGSAVGETRYVNPC